MDPAASLDPFFRPSSVAVIGASRRADSIGYRILDNLIRHGYQGVAHPVNPTAASVHSVVAVPSVRDLAGPVELAVIVVPRDAVLGVVEECGEKGVKALVVITAGFKEVGAEGAQRERVLRERARAWGMRLVGPNCMGILNTDARVSMNATFAPTMPPAGPSSFMSQSGALGVTILDYAAEFRIGIHHFVSVGNKADVSGNDLLEYWEREPGTRVILMYLENFGNPRRFTRIARRVTRTKPIVVVKSGRTRAGARAASSHTGALASADDATDALLAQCGVLRANSVGELFDIAMALEAQPVPRGNRVAILTNAGGPGIIIADACESSGLEVPELSAETRERLQETLPEEASVRNPVDMIASATADSYRTALDHVLADPEIDAAIAAFVPPLGIRQVDVASAIVDARRKHPAKPVLAVLMGREGLPEGRAQLGAAGIPAYTFPESAARALSALHRYRVWLDRPLEEPTVFDVDRDRVARLADGVRGEGRTHLMEPEALEVLEAYGIPTVERRIVSTGAEALEAAGELGYPVVVKAVARGLVHKTEMGAVRVDLRTRGAVEAAIEAIRAAVEDAGMSPEGWLVERFLEGGKEVIVGMDVDPAFGPVMMVGLGGIYVEALADVAFRVQPVTRSDALDMLASLRARRLLEGMRGEATVDLEALAGVIQRASQLVGDHPAIGELDINPLLAFADGVVAVDARIRLERG